jgi:hypothetical protein
MKNDKPGIAMIGIGTAIGIGIGGIVSMATHNPGMATHNPGLWLPVGAAIGAALGGAMILATRKTRQ